MDSWVVAHGSPRLSWRDSETVILKKPALSPAVPETRALGLALSPLAEHMGDPAFPFVWVGVAEPFSQSGQLWVPLNRAWRRREPGAQGLLLLLPTLHFASFLILQTCSLAPPGIESPEEGEEEGGRRVLVAGAALSGSRGWVCGLHL